MTLLDRAFAIRPQQGRNARQRGVTLVEGILYLALAAGLLAFSVRLVQEQTDAQQERIAGANLALVLTAAQRHVVVNYEDLLAELAATAIASASSNGAGAALVERNLTLLTAGGFLPGVFLNAPGGLTARTPFGQDYAIVLRAVDRRDTANPQSTLTSADLDADGVAGLDPVWTDGDPDNGELDLEVLLVTTGADPVDAPRGVRTVEFAETAAAGFVQEIEGTSAAYGPYGSWRLSLTPYAGTAAASGDGYFVSLVALSRSGVLGLAPGAPDEQDYVVRCNGILESLGRESAAYQTCLRATDIRSSIVFDTSGFDSDADGTADTFPGIQGVDTIVMAPPRDTDGDDVPDRGGDIAGLTRVTCADATEGVITAGTLVISCPTTAVGGALEVASTLDVGGAASVGGNLNVDGAQITLAGTAITNGGLAGLAGANGVDVGATLRADRMVMEDFGNADLGTVILSSRYYRPQDTIPKPVCGRTLDGVQEMVPRLYVTPIAYASQADAPLLGVYPTAEDLGGAGWRVRLFQYVAEDELVNGPTNMPGAPGTDNRADLYEVSPGNGVLLVQTRCTPS
jgi:hypothetical protein